MYRRDYWQVWIITGLYLPQEPLSYLLAGRALVLFFSHGFLLFRDWRLRYYPQLPVTSYQAGSSSAQDWWLKNPVSSAQVLYLYPESFDNQSRWVAINILLKQ